MTKQIKKIKPMSGQYILDKNGKPKKADDLFKWAKWLEEARKDSLKENKYGFRVGYTKLKNHYVSTVFLALDYSFGGKKPVLWETMVFENKVSTHKLSGGKTMKYHKDVQAFGMFDRYTSRKDAEAGHAKIVGMMKVLEKNQLKKKKK